jgi:hypothetical protein
MFLLLLRIVGMKPEGSWGQDHKAGINAAAQLRQ